MKLAIGSIGRHMYLSGIGYLGLVCILSKKFVITRPNIDFFQNYNEGIAYISGSILILASVNLMVRKLQVPSALSIALILFLLSTTLHLGHLWTDSVNGFKSILLLSGLIFVCDFPIVRRENKKYLLYLTLFFASMFFMNCAVAHVQFVDFVSTLVPTFMPQPKVFTLFAALCLAFGAIGFLVLPTQKLASLLSGIMITSWFLMIHIPRAIIGPYEENIGVGESLAMAGIFFCIFDVLSDKNKMHAMD